MFFVCLQLIPVLLQGIVSTDTGVTSLSGHKRPNSPGACVQTDVNALLERAWGEVSFLSLLDRDTCLQLFDYQYIYKNMGGGKTLYIKHLRLHTGLRKNAGSVASARLPYNILSGSIMFIRMYTVNFVCKYKYFF